MTLSAVHAEQWRCGRQSRPLRPQRKLFFTASLLAGARAAAARAATAAVAAVTITAAPTAPVVRGGCPPPPPPLHLQPPTTPWPSPTPTYTSSGCRPGRGRRPDSCCLCQSWWAAAAPVPPRPHSWSCTGTRPANGGRGSPGGGKWGPTWPRAGRKRRGGRPPCSVYSEMCPWLLTQVRLPLTFFFLTCCWSCFERIRHRWFRFEAAVLSVLWTTTATGGAPVVTKALDDKQWDVNSKVSFVHWVNLHNVAWIYASFVNMSYN